MNEFLYDMVLQLATVVGLSLFIGIILSRALIKIGRRAGIARAHLISIRKLIRVVTVVFAAAGIVEVLGLGSSLELLTIGGIGALVVSLALQGILSSMVYGFLASGQDIIRLGDLVEIAAAGKGRIVKVALRNTWIKTDSGALVVINNARLEQGGFWNYSAAERLEKRFDHKSSIE